MTLSSESEHVSAKKALRSKLLASLFLYVALALRSSIGEKSSERAKAALSIV